MMVELWTRKWQMGDEDENYMEDASRDEKAGVGVADWVYKTLCQKYYPPNLDSYLLSWGWSIDWHTNLYEVPVSHDDFPHLL